MNTAASTIHPPAPTNVRVIRDRGPKLPPMEIPCTPIYAGNDGEMDWWTVRTVTDEWVLITDTIASDPLPANTRISGHPVRADAA